MVDDNPVARIESLKIESTIKKAFSGKELEALMTASTHPRDRALLEFLYSTGVRVSELCSLNVGDIDLYRQQFQVTVSYTHLVCKQDGWLHEAGAERSNPTDKERPEVVQHV